VKEVILVEALKKGIY